MTGSIGHLSGHRQDPFVSAQSLPAVPVVDISNPSATSLAALDAACRDHGFFLLAGHGLDALIEHTWRETERFFDADRAVRQAVVRDQANPLGWFDRELTKRRRDQKEVFDFVDPRCRVSIARTAGRTTCPASAIRW